MTHRNIEVKLNYNSNIYDIDRAVLFPVLNKIYFEYFKLFRLCPKFKNIAILL